MLKSAFYISILVFSLPSFLMSCKKKEYWPKKSEKVITPLTKRFDLNFSNNLYYSSVEKILPNVSNEDSIWILQRIQEKENDPTFMVIEKRTLDANNVMYKSENDSTVQDFLIFNFSSKNKEVIFLVDEIGIKYFTNKEDLNSIDLTNINCPLQRANLREVNHVLYLNYISCGKNILHSFSVNTSANTLNVEIQEEIVIDYLGDNSTVSSLDFSMIFHDKKYPDEMIIASNKHKDQKINFSIFKLQEDTNGPRILTYSLNNKTSFVPFKFAYKNKQLYIVGSKLNSIQENKDYNINLVNIDVSELKIKFQQEYHLSVQDDFPKDIKILENNTLGICGVMNFNKDDAQKNADGFYLHVDENGKILSQKGLGSSGLDILNTIAEYKEKIVYLGGLTQSKNSIIQYIVY